MPKSRNPELTPARRTERKQLRTVDARQDDIVQVCFECPDEVWMGIKAARPPVLELQEFATLVLDRAVPKTDIAKACVDPAHKVPKPPAISLDDRAVKVRCFKTKRVLWGLLIHWAAISGNDLKELLSGVLADYLKKQHPKKGSKKGK